MTRKWKPTVLAILLTLTLGMVPFAIDSAHAAFPAGTSAYLALDDDQQPDPPDASQYVEEINNPAADGECIAGGCPTFVAAPDGQVNNAQTFDGTAEGLDLAENTIFDWAATDNFSISVWVRRAATAVVGNEVAIGRDDTSAGAPGVGVHWWVGVTETGAGGATNVPAFVLRDDGIALDDPNNANGVVGSTAINDGNWHHIVAVKDEGAGELRIYVDGVLEDTETIGQNFYSTGFETTEPVNIGYMDFRNAANFFFEGGIDEVAFFNKALTDQEVSDLFDLGDAGDSLGSDPEPLFDSIVVGDLNGNGPEDLAGVSTTGEVYYSLNLMSWVKIPGVVQSIATGDFDGDGDEDIAGINPDGLSAKVFYTTDLINWTPIPGLITSIVSGDFDGDGDDDIAGINPDGVISKIFYTTDLSTWTPIPGLITSIVAGDFDGDGTEGIAGINPDGVISKIFYTNDLVNWTPIPGLITSIAAGNFDGNGTEDIAGINPDGVISKIFYTLDLVNWTPIPGLITMIDVGDFNDDGVDDITGINPDGVAFKVFYTTDLSSWTGVPTAAPGALEMIATGDFNDDGIDDLAGVNGAGEVYYTLDFTDWTSVP